MTLAELKKGVRLENFLISLNYTQNLETSKGTQKTYSNGHETLVLSQGNDCTVYYTLGASSERGTIVDFLKNRPELLSHYQDSNIFEKVRKCLLDYVTKSQKELSRPSLSSEYQENAKLLNDLKKNVDLESLLSSLQYTKDKQHSTKSRPVYCGKNGEKLVLKTGNENYKVYFVRESSETGSIIDFLKNRPELLSHYQDSNIFEKVRKYLLEFSNTQHIHFIAPPITTTTPFELTKESYFIPQDKNINSRDFYFLKYRGISQETLNSSIFSNVGLTKNKYGYNNIAFPMFNEREEIKGIDFRYIKDSISYKMFLPGSDKNHSIGISSNRRDGINELFLCESPIDAMSHYQQYRNQKTNMLYAYFGGNITKGQIDTTLKFIDTLKGHHPLNITLGFDNDLNLKLTGQAYTTSIMCSILTKIPVPVSYANEDKFSFCIDKTPTSSFDFFSDLFKNMEGIELQENPNNFCFTVVKNKDVINAINNSLQKILPDIKIETPVTKDWNDDLKMKQKNIQAISLKTSIEIDKEKKTKPHSGLTL